MNWTTVIIIVAVVAVIFILKQAGQISLKDAQEHLKNGALVIDVRSAGEFSSGHLAQAVNMPMEQLETALSGQVTDKERVLLLHCLSGTRSGMAKAKLKSLGYTNAFNLGSLARARKIVGVGEKLSASSLSVRQSTPHPTRNSSTSTPDET